MYSTSASLARTTGLLRSASLESGPWLRTASCGGCLVPASGVFFYFLKFGISAGNVVRTESSLFSWILASSQQAVQRPQETTQEGQTELSWVLQLRSEVVHCHLSHNDYLRFKERKHRRYLFPHYYSVEENTEDTIVLLLSLGQSVTGFNQQKFNFCSYHKVT